MATIRYTDKPYGGHGLQRTIGASAFRLIVALWTAHQRWARGPFVYLSPRGNRGGACITSVAGERSNEFVIHAQEPIRCA
jgi:hypothetical protein